MAEMLPILGGLLGTAIKLGEYAVVPVKRQFNYLCCYETNIANLKNQVRKLDNTRIGLQLSVDEAKRNAEGIGPDVEDWLRRANETMNKVADIYELASDIGKGCLNGCSINLRSRYSVSRKVRKIIKVVIELQNTCRFERISYPAPPSSIEYRPTVAVNGFASRKLTVTTILKALKDANVGVIGLCGMGGVGKTTMVKYISKRVKEDCLFDEIAMAVVTREPDLLKIQGEIAASLHMELKEESLQNRASRLFSRIKKVERILIILDDVWACLNLEDLGIPLRSEHLGCKILLTSRHHDVCAAMEAQNILLAVLSEQESWDLFKEKAGDVINSSDLYPTARDVANECKGLPIALVTVARALKGKSLPVWQDALQQLKRSIPENIPGLLKDVYQSLELSYNHLESHEAKSLFLFCYLFKEDFDIYMHDLAKYGMALGMFAALQNLNEAMNRVHTLVGTLKDRFMILEGRDAVHVKVHDVVRDVGISIASDAFLISHDVNSRQWPSRQSYEQIRYVSVILNAAMEIPRGLNCPKLEFLLCESSGQGSKMPESMFEGLKRLHVVVINRMDIRSFPSLLESVTNLQVMILRQCRMENVSIVGELVNLKVLSFCRSDIQVLPIEIGKLTSLRSLDLSMCRNLVRIAPGVLSRLIKLEELNMLNSFQGWEVEEEGIERSNASLSELEVLSSLKTLKIQLPNRPVIFRNISLSTVPTAYYLIIGTGPRKSERYFQRQMDLFLPPTTPLGEWFDSMVKSCERISLGGDGSQNVVNVLAQVGLCQVQELHLRDCHSVEYLANIVEEVSSTCPVFPVLESLVLVRLSKLEGIFRGPFPAISFSRLTELTLTRLSSLKQLWETSRSVSLPMLNSIYVDQCQKLQHLFSLSTVRGLMQLEKLRIVECKEMKEVFTRDSGEDGIMANEIELPRLKELILERLPCVTDFCRGFENFVFPGLFLMKIEHLPKLEGFQFKKTRFIPEPKCTLPSST